MDSKKKLTNTEELTKQCEEAKKKFEELQAKLEYALCEEAAKKEAELELEKETRMKEIEEAHKHYKELLNAFIKDYGSYATSISAEDILNSIFSPWWRQ